MNEIIKFDNVNFQLPASNHAGKANGAVGAQIVSGVGQTKHYQILSDISFSLNAGDRLGIIGHNGAGKTMLLRLMSGIIVPSGGRIEVKGKISSLMNISYGLNSSLTGRENAYIRMRLQGLSHKAAKEELPAVKDWTEMGPFFEEPIAKYSAGMRTRLAFACATVGSPDVVIMDEWIGAGDASFQEKAKDRLEGYLKSASVLVFCSHSIKLMNVWANKGLWISKGKLMDYGDLTTVFNNYWMHEGGGR